MKKFNFLICFIKDLLFFACFFLILPSCDNRKDVTHDLYVKDFVNRCLELKQDAFLFKWSDTKEYDIDLPGEISYTSVLPMSIEDYLKHPNDWWNTESYKKLYGTFGPGREKEDVIGILTKGTHLKLVKVLYIENYGGVRHRCFVEILDGPFKGIQSSFHFIDGTPYSYSKQLKIDERAIKFCEEPTSNSSNS